MKEKKIIIVDNDQMLCNLLKKQINNNIKCNIVIVYNGLDCLKFFQSNVCDLIIMDINMPILNGIDTRQQINNKETGRNVPIIFISANINNKKKIPNNDKTFFFSKPINNNKFLILINELLNK